MNSSFHLSFKAWLYGCATVAAAISFVPSPASAQYVPCVPCYDGAPPEGSEPTPPSPPPSPAPSAIEAPGGSSQVDLGSVPQTSSGFGGDKWFDQTAERARIEQQATSPSSAPASSAFGGSEAYKQEIVLVVRQETLSTTVSLLQEKYGLTVITSSPLRNLGDVMLVMRVGKYEEIPGLLAALSTESEVVSAQRNQRFQTTATETQPVAGRAPQYALRKLNLSGLDGQVTGKGVTVAVIDTVVDNRHPSLAGKIADTINIDVKSDLAPPHGTGMAGIIGAEGTILGIAPNSRMLAIEAFEPDPQNPQSGVTTTDRLVRAVDVALSNQAQVINMSFAGPYDPLLERAIHTATEKGAIVVAAAGNAGPGTPPAYPAGLQGVVAVTAIDAKDRIYRHANQGEYISVAAPGVDIVTLAPNDKVQITSGTSIAAAHVSAVVALMIEVNPNLKPEDALAIIRNSAKDLGDHGFDPVYGAGLIDPVRAVTLARGGV